MTLRLSRSLEMVLHDCATCGLQERRVIEYVALGDFATAVGFLLASSPEKSARYYRDALCTLALAVCHPSPTPLSLPPPPSWPSVYHLRLWPDIVLCDHLTITFLWPCQCSRIRKLRLTQLSTTPLRKAASANKAKWHQVLQQ